MWVSTLIAERSQLLTGAVAGNGPPPFRGRLRSGIGHPEDVLIAGAVLVWKAQIDVVVEAVCALGSRLCAGKPSVRWEAVCALAVDIALHLLHDS